MYKPEPYFWQDSVTDLSFSRVFSFYRSHAISFGQIFTIFQATDENIRLVNFSDIMTELLSKYLSCVCNSVPDDL